MGARLGARCARVKSLLHVDVRNTKEDVVEIVNAGADGGRIKPILPAIVQQKLREGLDRQRRAGEAVA